MMVPLLRTIKEKQGEHRIAMEKFYSYIGITRQGFFQAAYRQQEKQLLISSIVKLVQNYRKKKDRRAGSRSLFYNLDIKTKFNIGVNKFEQLMSVNGLSLAPMRIRVVTTKSSMQSWNYPNLINGLPVEDINKVVVGDLTYVYFQGQRYFLFCLTDLYSARIVGYHIGFNMRAADAKRALDMWEGLREKVNLKGCIHHTDGGSQYFSELYLTQLKRLDIQVSCAENCLMNGYAEQRNGLLKHHLIPTMKGSCEREFNSEIKRIMHVYNHERKQKALGWLSPVEFEKKISGMVNKPKLLLYKFNNNKNGF
ncbi:MAG: transposase [Candidatus Cyclobacteriaceae bacterium M2_1C_046]